METIYLILMLSRNCYYGNLNQHNVYNNKKNKQLKQENNNKITRMLPINKKIN